MNSPLLSICIPTYNRPHYLERALKSLTEQILDNPNLSSQIEIVVSDNCSPEETRKVAESYQKNFPQVKYFRNETNVGFDKNILNVVTKATGKYCWYLGDDDVIENGALEFVCNTLKERNPDFIGFHSEPIIEDESYLKLNNYSSKDIISENDFNEFYFKGYCQGGVSVLLFNRDQWLSVLDSENYLEHWLYYETVLKILVKTKNPMLFITAPVVKTGQDCRWAENGTELFTFINSNILLEAMLKMGYDKDRINKTLKENALKIIIVLLRAKSNNLKINKKNLAYIYKHMAYLPIHYKILLTIIYFIPNRILKIIKSIKKKLFR